MSNQPENQPDTEGISSKNQLEPRGFEPLTSSMPLRGNTEDCNAGAVTPKHTPSPWKFGVEFYNPESRSYELVEQPFDYNPRNYSDNPFILASVNGRVETIAGCDEYHVFGKNPANIRLMCAAPDLLAALKEATRCLAWHEEQHGVGMDRVAVKAALAAIAKAEGRVE